MRRRILLGLGMILLVASFWLGQTTNLHVWPVRNTVQYTVMQRWDRWFGRTPGPPVTIHGQVHDPTGKPIPEAQVLVAAHDGTSYSAESDANGEFTLANVPAGQYAPVAGARGYDDTVVRSLGMLRVGLDATTNLDITLKPATPRQIAPPENVTLDPAQALQISQPLPATAVRQAVHFAVGERSNQTTLYYTPNDGQQSTLPLLLAVYPGPADEWESVSFPLAQAGYAVLAIGPAYSLDLETDVDDLERLLDLARAGQFPRADPAKIGVLAGSYSGLHVFRLMERNTQPIQAALFLGPPTDLFEMRRQFSAGEIAPPFGLDKLLIALGFPDRNPEPYWQYSARYHARSISAPVMLIHSKADDVVPFPQSEQLAAELTRIGKPHELHILEHMGHYLLATERTPEIDDLFNLTVGFFQEHLR